MKLTVDTDILVRAVVRDDERQGDLAAALLGNAELIAVPLPCLCEFVWVLRRVYGFERADIQGALRVLIGAGNVSVDRSAVESGLAVMDAGGDFADGLIAHEGHRLGGEMFASFDKRAVTLVAGLGYRSTVPA